MTSLAAQYPGAATPLPPLPPLPEVPARYNQDRSAATVAPNPLDIVKKGDCVIWMRGGQQAYSDGTVAFVSNVYVGGEGIDLLIPTGTGVLEAKSLVQHVNERENVPENRQRSSGLWMLKEEHHLILQNDRVNRERKKQEQLRRQQGGSFTELGPIK